LIFFCNPNNPVATYVGARATREFLFKVNRISPDTTILVDEAYFDYVTNPDHATHIPLAVEDPRIMVARTFSKAYGMAGLRIGYAVGHPETIKEDGDWDSGSARAR
jgi:histidinol-phosphate aminotransferase